MAVKQLTLDIDNMYTTTWQYIQPTAVDNIFKSTPTLQFFMASGRIKKITGFSRLEFPLEYANQDSSVAWFGKTHDLSTQVTAAKSVEFLTTVQVDWRYLGATIYRFWVDDQKNTGKAQIMSLIDAKLSNARRTLESNLSGAMFSLNTPASDSKIEGLPNWIRPTPNPAYASRYTQGGIAQGEIGSGSGTYNNTWWNNQAYDMTNEDVSLNLTGRMTNMYNTCSNGNDVPDVLITTQAVYESYEAETQEYKQIVNQNTGDVAFGSLMFKGKPIIWDAGCGANLMYFINSKYMYLVFDSGVFFEMTDWKEGRADLDRVCQIISALNLVCTNRARQGVISGIGAQS
jgi:hypothetical protein